MIMIHFLHWTLSHIQTKLLSHQWKLDSWWGMSLLFILIWIDTALYNYNRLQFGEIRRKQFGPFFTGLGRIICVDYQFTRQSIQQTQQRSNYIGRLKFPSHLFSPYFLLYLSNKSTDNHPIFHNHLVHYIFNSQTQQRLHDTYLQNLIKSLTNSIRLSQPRSQRKLKPLQINGSCQIDFDLDRVETYLLDILFYLFLNLKLTDTIRQDLHYLTTIKKSSGPRYLTSRISGNIDTVREKNIISFISSSSILNNYQTPPEDPQFGIPQISELLLNILIIAGYLGTINTLLASLSTNIHGIGLDFKQLPTDPNDFRPYLLEIIRTFGPVNFINTVLEKDTPFTIGKKEYLFPQSTILSLSLFNSGYDPQGPFTNPHQFNYKREDLENNCIHFHHPGLGQGQLLNNRACPARFIILNLLSTILSHLQ